MAETAKPRQIQVGNHAVDRYREWVQPREMGNKHIRTRIHDLVRRGLEAGNVANYKPEGFLLYGERRRQLPAGQRFVWCEEEPRLGFIVQRNPDEPDFVKTTMIRVGVSR